MEDIFDIIGYVIEFMQNNSITLWGFTVSLWDITIFSSVAFIIANAISKIIYQD